MASQTKPQSCAELVEIQSIMAEWHHECFSERHWFNGVPLIVVDHDGMPVAAGGGGHFAWPDGTRVTAENAPGWPKGQVTEPCGECESCRLSILGCGLIDIIDGSGPRSVSLAVDKRAKPQG